VGLDQVEGQVFNIGSGRDVAVESIADTVLDRLNKPKSLITYIGDRPGQVERHFSSTEKALQTLGWTAEHDFDKGIAKTIKWYQENRDWWQRLLWMRHVPTRTRDGRLEYH